MSGNRERGLMLMIKKFGILGALSELLEPHLLGKTAALKFGTIGVHHTDRHQRISYPLIIKKNPELILLRRIRSSDCN